MLWTRLVCLVVLHLCCLSFTLRAIADDNIASQPFPRSPNPDSTGTRFELLSTDTTGIDFVQPIDTSHFRKYLYVGGYASPGIAIGDLDQDGRQDIFIAGGPVPNRLYIQSSDPAKALSFADMTDQAKDLDGGTAWSAGATLVDIDSDGDLDIYVCNYDLPNQLFVNDSKPGQIRFTDQAKEYGLDLVDSSFMSTFCDYDLDGDLDVFIVGYQYLDPSGRPKDPPVDQKNGEYSVKPGYDKYYGIITGPDGKPMFTNVGREDYLLQNNAANSPNGKPMFTDVTKRAGIDGTGIGNSAVWWDYNSDGLPDIYVANDFKVADQLFRNNGDGTFTDVIRQAFSHTTWYSMGSEVGDINNDGRLDLFVSDMAGTTHYRSKVTMGNMGADTHFMSTSEPRQLMRNALYLNTGTPHFLEAAYLAGLANSDWSWAVKLADFDNDRRVDVVITNGAARMFNHSDYNFSDAERIGKTYWDLWEATPIRKEENLAFKNLGDLRFEDVGAAWGLQRLSMSYSAAYGDLDGDGDLDLIIANLDEPVSVYRNQSTEGHSVRLRLVGKQGNTFGVGAVVSLAASDGTATNEGDIQTRQVSPVMGFLSCNEPYVHFGLGDATSVSTLTIEWPGGRRQTFTDLAADCLYTITEPDTSDDDQQPTSNDPPLFVLSDNSSLPRHHEAEFNDFERQPLLPFMHSQLGPGIALGDVDGDGDMDLYMAQGKGHVGGVQINLGNGEYQWAPHDAFAGDEIFEDMGALFFDADSDGDRDLYVVSGSVECDPGDLSLQDRLYLNDGQGRFSRAAQSALPALRDSGSVVCAADFDRDGDLDLFVGGRVVPGKYPVTPESHLLKNNSRDGKPDFADETQSVAPELGKSGLVTSAVWSDVDDDGWIDLIVTHEWGPVKLYHNEATKNGDARQLVNRTDEAGLGEWLGWWNGIAASDLDNDGDVDFVVTNFGLNTTYHASEEKPELLYYGDFDGTGKPHLVEAKFENDKCFPRRGLSCSSRAMPFVRQKVNTFHQFGLSTLEEIYTESKLHESLRMVVNTLETGTLVNMGPRGEGQVPRFQFQPLPTLAQISPAYGVNIADFDGDGWQDCFVAQNFYSPQIETGRMDSGLSALLRGRGHVRDDQKMNSLFEEVWPAESGVTIDGDAKSSAVTDVNEDGWSDIIVTMNNDTLRTLTARPSATNRVLSVHLAGQSGNPDGVGAKLTLEFSDNTAPNQFREVYAGGGYLSQSAPTVTFGCGIHQPVKLSIRWPNGKTTSHDIPSGQSQLLIRQ